MKALIVEDDAYTREALQIIFEEDGWQVQGCADGNQGKQVFTQNPESYDLVCLDVMMPGMSGYEVCRAIRKINSSVPVLFISAKSEEIDKVLGLELGADDFVVKPFGVREVLARVHALVRRSNRQVPEAGAVTGTLAATQTKENEAFTFGPWNIVPSQLRASAEGKTLDLLPREVLMLRLLVREPGKVISRGEFFRTCWDLDNPPLSRTLDQHIAQLRKKIEIDPGKPELIKTVQGVGYRHG